MQQKDYKTIFKRLLVKANSEGLLNLTESTIEDLVNGVDIENMYALLLSVYGNEEAELYDYAYQVYLANDINLATGHDLDVIGEKLGLPRYGATKATTTIQFSTEDTLLEPVTVQAGIECETSNGGIYVTDTEFSIASEGSTTVTATSKWSGKLSRVSTGTINTIITHVSDVNLTCTNITPSYGGRDAETDTDYRARLKNWRKIAEKGNEESYRNVLNNLDGLEDYRLVPKWDGTGTIKIITVPSTDTIKNNVYNKIQEEAVLYDEDLTVVGANEYPIEIYCQINIDYDVLNPYSLTEKREIGLKVERSIHEYIDKMKLGQDFIPFQCGVYLNQNIPELKDISFSKPDAPIVIDDDSKITLTECKVVIE